MLKVIENYNYKQLSYNRKLIDTNHSIDRFSDKNRFDKRQKDLLNSDIIKVANNMLKQLLTKYKDVSGVYGVHSKSTGIGMVVDFRKDYLSNDNLNHLIIITLLPIKSFHHFKDTDGNLIVEKIESDLMFDLYKESLTIKELKRLKEGKSIPDYCLLKYDGKENFPIVVENNKYLYSGIEKFIIVE